MAPPTPSEVATLPAIAPELLRTALGNGWAMVAALGSLAVERGTTPWLVGGSVRDLLMGKPVRDADVVVEGDAAALAQAAATQLGGTAFVHSSFGTAKWTPPGWRPTDEPIDIATARTETYPQPACLPVVAPARLQRDLHRRDFTLNAMAVCLHPARLGEVLDPFDGRRDLQQKVLRVLHGQSFDDDPTRALRAARFAARFDLTLTTDTRALLTAALQRDAFHPLSTDRLGAELDRLLREPDPVAALRLLHTWELVPVLHARWQLDASLLRRLALFVKAARRLTAHHPKAAEEPLAVQADGAWTVLAGGLTPEDRRAAAALIPGPKTRRTRFLLGPEAIDRALAVLHPSARPSEVARTLASLDSVQLLLTQAWSGDTPTPDAAQSQLAWWMETGRHIRTAVDGRWLMQQGQSPGPGFADALNTALDVARDGGSVAEQRTAALARLE